MTEARDRVATLRGSVAAATTAYERADAVVDIVRGAPAQALAIKMAALGSGPMAITVSEAGGVDVTIDGRPWGCASTGRRIVADADFRARLRSAVRLAWLPVIIDEAQSVGGQALPDCGGQTVVLVTTDGVLAVTGGSDGV